MKIIVPACPKVQRLLGLRIRVDSGYGEVLTVGNFGDGTVAEVEVEVEDANA
jgi:hypothetical protein